MTLLIDVLKIVFNDMQPRMFLNILTIGNTIFILVCFVFFLFLCVFFT